MMALLSLPLSLSFLLLSTACSTQQTSDASSNSSVFKVTYYDDAPTPVAIGYSYVTKGQSAPSPLRFYDGGESYDKLSHSGQLPSAIGAYRSFTGYAGFYDKETKQNPVDLTSIQGDCEVQATFVEKTYSWSFAFYNASRVMAGKSQTIVFDGTKECLPSFPKEAETVDPAPLWYENSTFTGFSFNLDSAASLYKSESALSFANGVGAPSSVAAAGTIYIDLTDNQGNRAYPLSLSNGTDWVSLGSLSGGLSLKLSANYSHSRKAFTASFYPSAADYKAGTNVLSSTLAFTYLTKLSFATSGTTTTVTNSDGENVAIELTAPKGWAGVYTGAAGLDPDAYKNTAVNLDDNLFENCAIYPL